MTASPGAVGRGEDEVDGGGDARGADEDVGAEDSAEEDGDVARKAADAQRHPEDGQVAPAGPGRRPQGARPPPGSPATSAGSRPPPPPSPYGTSLVTAIRLTATSGFVNGQSG